MEGESLSDLFEHSEFPETNLQGAMAPSPDDIFSILEAFESVPLDFNPLTPQDETTGFAASKDEEDHQNGKSVEAASPTRKRAKLSAAASNSEDANQDISQRISHITVERNRRKQMNEHLSVLRSLMPCFYVKRGDQASIIGGVVDYINELQQVLQSLEAKKQRKVIYSDVLSPRFVSSPRPSPLSPRKPPLSPRMSLPISPRTPQPSSPYRPRTPLEPSPASSSASSINDGVNELVENSKSAIAEVEVKFSGPNNLLLKTVSPPIPGQAVKIMSALEDLSLETLHVNISTINDETVVNSFTIKIGIECQLSAEELAHQIQQTFC